MVSHIFNTLCANHAINSADGEWTIEIVGRLGVEVIDFNLPRAVDILAVTQIQANVSDTACGAVAKEKQVTRLSVVPVGNFLSSQCLL